MKVFTGVLAIKLRRELWQMRGQVLAIALVIAGGVAVCVMSLVNYSSLNATRSEYYDQYRFADVFAGLKRAPGHVAKRIKSLPGVETADARVEGWAKLEVPGFDDPVTGQLLSLPPSGQPLVNQVFVREGRLPVGERRREVAVIGSFADAHGLAPGDRIGAIINGRRQLLTISGIVESPEFIYVIPPGGMLPDYERYGVLWMNREALAAAMDMKGAFNSLVLTVKSGYPAASVIDALDRLLDRYGATGAYAREDQFSHRFLTDELRQLKTMATVFPLIFMSVAMFLLNVVITRLISTQRDIIAVLKAFGYGNRDIAAHYSQLVLVIAVIGLAIGLALGLWLGQGLAEMYMQYYRFPGLLFRINPGWIALITAITLVVAWLGGWAAIRRAAALPPAEAMRPEGPATYRVSWAEHVLSGIGFSQPSRMIVRQTMRRPLRTFLSMLGVAMATGIIMVGNFQFDSVTLMVHTQFARVQQQDVTVAFIDPVNSAALFGLQRQPGIRYVEGRRMVPARLINEQLEWRTGIAGIPEGARLQHVIDANLKSVELPARGLLLTDFLAQKMAVSPGDVVKVEILEGDRRILSVPVAGVTSEFLGVGAYMSLEGLNRALGEGPVINQVVMNVDPRYADRIYNDLRETPKVLGIAIRQAMLDSFYETLAKTFLTFTFFSSLLGGVIAFGVIYNTVRISLAEKGRELASLRVLGYTHNEIAHILLGEMAILLLLGIPMGWLIGNGLAMLLITAMQTELYRVPLIVTSQTLGVSAATVVVSAVASGAIAWWRLKKLDLVAVLKTRE
ncbi:ABC-type antimicrobial peptide transport system, permease component [Marinobacter nitratireducens]|uniref:ABC-type antimicrobial peptide transport system, permease component n=1 Tax=Marinobacter nitratireducens TaxID=1137280 RepID=A0A072NG82_9GAMM|nr:ABC transporter permease [Marinobacter nitratireducens]KEF32095.1 ABC-type antimicrobial peptide transport system, permease component [Marinobacter nitratireducens]